LSYAVAGRRSARYGNTIAAGALVLALSYVTLEIRRLYHGPQLTSGLTGGAEQYTYSIAWLVFGVLLIGRVRYGWRGRSAVGWTLGGFGVLALAYFGSKFVLEYVLGRHWG